MLWLVVLALFGSFVSLYYYLSVLKVIYVDRPSAAETGHSSPITHDLIANATVAVLAATVVFFGVLPQILAAAIAKSVP